MKNITIPRPFTDRMGPGEYLSADKVHLFLDQDLVRLTAPRKLPRAQVWRCFFNAGFFIQECIDNKTSGSGHGIGREDEILSPDPYSQLP
ncbi:MAG: hypothetical protein H8E43_10450 [Planctomycetia bacterium]|nr:hypothetical protein [Planctomycetia bacterium]MBL6913791.1 hypothetical protein [Planctomycetota bacterium]HCW45237.1 hypothetical protein [Planctomycetota bacterium]